MFSMKRPCTSMSRRIDSHYKELFRIPDGERIIVTDRDGKTESYPCRYICPDGVAAAGKAAYVERNQAMIRASDFCVFYFNDEYLPESRKESKKAITSYQPKSGTRLAFDYAKANGKTIINLYTEDEHRN